MDEKGTCDEIIKIGEFSLIFPFELEDESLCDLDIEQPRFIGRARYLSTIRKAREMAAGNYMQTLCANKLVRLSISLRISFSVSVQGLRNVRKKIVTLLREAFCFSQQSRRSLHEIPVFRNFA